MIVFHSYIEYTREIRTRQLVPVPIFFNKLLLREIIIMHVLCTCTGTNLQASRGRLESVILYMLANVVK